MRTRFILLFPILVSTLLLITTPTSAQEQNTNSESNTLIQRLRTDKLINEFEGFVVEKKLQTLFINGKQVEQTIASKYISSLKEENIRVQVFSFKERFNMHPSSNMLQLLAPVMFQSPCIQKTESKKPGC
jgi:hypothetical protein